MSRQLPPVQAPRGHMPPTRSGKLGLGLVLNASTDIRVVSTFAVYCAVSNSLQLNTQWSEGGNVMNSELWEADVGSGGGVSVSGGRRGSLFSGAANMGFAGDMITSTSRQWIDNVRLKCLKHSVWVLVGVDPLCTIATEVVYQLVIVGVVLGQWRSHSFLCPPRVDPQSVLDVLSHRRIVQKMVMVTGVRVGRL